MKRFAAAVVVCTLLAGMLAGCGGNGNTKNETSSTVQQSSSTEVVEVIPEPTATPEPYFPNPLTGLEKDESYPEGQRITAVMVNNIKACRPQRGLSDAKVLYEIKVEGGITRFMALYDDYNTIPTIGPIRSARDQFFRLVLPFSLCMYTLVKVVYKSNTLLTMTMMSGTLMIKNLEICSGEITTVWHRDMLLSILLTNRYTYSLTHCRILAPMTVEATTAVFSTL